MCTQPIHNVMITSVCREEGLEMWEGRGREKGRGRGRGRGGGTILKIDASVHMGKVLKC